jgi:hypothetical protein
MPDLTTHQRATHIASDFISTEFDDQQQVVHWLIERITVAIEDAERAARRVSIPLRTFYPGH